MFLTCGMVPAAAAMDYNGNFQVGYQEIDGISLGYLQINGTRMFALTQVFSDLFKGIPRATVSKKMESLKIQSRRCDLRELRTLKAIHSVPMRAVKCSLISKADLEALRTSCQAGAPRRRRRRRRRKKSKRRAPGGDFFGRPRLLPPYGASEGAFRANGGAPRDALFGEPFARAYEKAAQSSAGRGRGRLLAGVLSAYPDDLQLLHSAVRAHRAGQTPAPPEPRRPRRSACACLAKEKGRSVSFPGSKRQGTSAGYSSDSDSSGASSPASSSDSSEEEDEDDDSSCSSEESSSSGSESSSLCSGDSVQSTRYRQAALPRIPAPGASSQALPGVGKVLRPDPNLLFWARTLRASTLESFKPAPSGTPKEEAQQEETVPCPKQETTSCPRSTAQANSGPVQGPQPTEGGVAEAQDSCVRARLSKDAACPTPGDELQAEKESTLQKDYAPGSGREAHFDRLIRQSKLWCYAKGFNVDGKGLRRAEQAKGSVCASKTGLLGLPNKALKGGGELERSAKRRHAEQERQAKGRPPKLPRKTSKKGASPPFKRLLGTSPAPARHSFTLMGTFPCTPALVVGSDGDLCPASSLCVKDSPRALSKTHPLWTWQLGSNAIPVPPSLKFRGYSLEDL